MKPKRYIVWSTNEIDLTNPFQRKWYIEQVLQHGKAEDVAELNKDELKELLPTLNLPKDIMGFWQWYFDKTGYDNTACILKEIIHLRDLNRWPENRSNRKVRDEFLSYAERLMEGLTP